MPLVVPEINPEACEAHKGIIANPNCSTIIAITPLWPIHKVNPIKRLIAATYQAASGAGAAQCRCCQRRPRLRRRARRVWEHRQASAARQRRRREKGKKMAPAKRLAGACGCRRVYPLSGSG